MIGSDNPKSSSTYTRSFSIHTTPTDPPIKPYPYTSIHRSESVKLSNSIKGKVINLCNIFESRRGSKPKPNPQFHSKLKPEKSIEPASIRLPGTEDRVVIYFTSLRGIRRTYEDCYSVRMILKSFRVCIDERDVSMDYSYRNELLSVLREKQVTLPQVFIKGEYVGGADVVKQLHETGQLAKVLNGVRVRSSGVFQVCDGCGDVRFVPCVNCNGSKKVFEEDGERLERCPYCNENGLIRCPSCCCS